MSAEDRIDIACWVCQMTYSNQEELSVHSCKQIKIEANEFEDQQKNYINEADDLKYDIDSEENDSDYRPKRKKRKKINNLKKATEQKNDEKSVEGSSGERKKRAYKKRKTSKVGIKEDMEELEYQEQLDFALGNQSDLELSEDFIVFILEQIDNLCENIKNGDPDTERTLEVNHNLNNAVSCYRNKLSKEKKILIKSESEEYYDHIESNVDSESKFELPKVKKKKKSGPYRKDVYDKELELVKNQCGKHTVNSMSLMLNIPYCTLKDRIQKQGLAWTEEKVECELCDLKKSIDNIDHDQLFPLMKYDIKKHKLGCLLCDFMTDKRGNLFIHIKSIHQSDIITFSSKNVETNHDCGNSTCKSLYGMIKGKRFWCKKCTKISQLPKAEKPELEERKKLYKLCPECGISTQNLKLHLDSVHFAEKQICPHCAKELSSMRGLKDHVKKVHEKIPCLECGRMVGPTVMSIHMQSHLPDDLKKYKCDVCGKGFPTNQHFKDHRNIHTGKKPYKCKFCSTCFASAGTRNMHQKSHLGIKRNSSK
jgi:hypothetical protein